MKTSFILIGILSLSLLIACEKEKTSVPEQKNVLLSEKQKQVVQQTNAFGFDFFKKVYAVSGSDQNLMVSPLSVSMAFGMTRNGAAGSTLEDMTTALGLSGMSDSEINESYKYILETFADLDPEVKIAIANSIWYRNTFSAEQNFLQTNQDYFHAEVNPLDFNSVSAVDEINQWVSDNTNKLIPTIIDQIPDEMVMYLINAVYFKGQWKYAFETKNTTEQPFYLADGSSSVTAPFMVQEASLKYFKGDGFAAAELPYHQGNYNMVIMLPDAGNSVAEVIAALSQESWNAMYSRFNETTVQMHLPKFKFAYEEKKMKEVMSDLGMAVAFNPDLADFTRINSDGGLYISEVRHKTFIETNEEGTEAAAVTSVGVGTTSVGEDPLPIQFNADKPFVFFIHEKSTGSILFIGTVMNPDSEK